MKCPLDKMVLDVIDPFLSPGAMDVHCLLCPKSDIICLSLTVGYLVVDCHIPQLQHYFIHG